MEELPRAIAALPKCWHDIYHALPPLAGYKDICAALGFSSPKSASCAFSADRPNAPFAYFFGREARFDRAEVVLWAFNRAKNAERRGRKPANVR